MKEGTRRPGLFLLALPLFITMSLFGQTPTGSYVAPSFDKQELGKVRAIDPSKGEFKIHKLASNLYMLQPIGVNGATGNFGANVSAFLGDDGIVLIDPGFLNMQPKLEAAIKTISDKPVKYVLNTHWHGDHTEADAPFAKAGAVIIAQDNVRMRMQTGSTRFIPSAVDALPSITFDREITLHIDGREIHGIRVPPGHTNTDAIYVYPEAKVVQMGDDFTFNNPRGGYPGWDMDADGAGGPEGPIAAYEYVLAHVGEDAKVIPGHGNLATGADLVRPLAFLKAATAAVQEDINEGKSLEQIKQEQVLAKLDYLEEGQAREDAYIERLYSALTHKNATPQPYIGNQR
jgi:glyoxylase-like metal-dependent hydrolase (beta-lactamase superfamily II)